MAKVRKRKKGSTDDDDTNCFKIMFLLMNTDKPMTLSQISKETEIQANLVFYYLKSLKKKHLAIETEDKTYSCQPFLLDGDVLEDIDSLLMIIIKLLAKEMQIKNRTEKELGVAVLENLKMYIDVFDIVVT